MQNDLMQNWRLPPRRTRRPPILNLIICILNSRSFNTFKNNFYTMKRSNMRVIKPLMLFCALCLTFNTNAQTVFPYDTRSDSIAIEHYNVRLDVRDFSTFILKGQTAIIFEPLVNNITEIRLDLLGL